MTVLKSFKDYMEEDAPLNATGDAINMNPTGKPRKMDRRSRFDVNKMYERSLGLKSLPQKK